MSEFKHIPIMLKEVLELLKPERGGIYADGTLGGGGHSEAILTALPDGGRRAFGVQPWRGGADNGASPRVLCPG